jgi:putative DNA primase/helicase
MNIESLNACFSNYLPTSGKRPLIPFDEAVDYNSVKDLDEYGGVIKNSVVLIDVDDFEQSERLMDIIEELQLNCVVTETTKGKHFYFADSGFFKSNSINQKLAVGIKADIKRGSVKSMGVIKYKGIERNCIWEYTPLTPAPVWLKPVETELDLWQLDIGSRNDTLFRYVRNLEKAELSKQDIKFTFDLINRFILKKSLSKSELNTILRDDVFTKKEVNAPEINSGYDLMQLELKPIEFIVKDM